MHVLGTQGRKGREKEEIDKRMEKLRWIYFFCNVLFRCGFPLCICPALIFGGGGLPGSPRPSPPSRGCRVGS